MVAELARVPIGHAWWRGVSAGMSPLEFPPRRADVSRLRPAPGVRKPPEAELQRCKRLCDAGSLACSLQVARDANGPRADQGTYVDLCPPLADSRERAAAGQPGWSSRERLRRASGAARDLRRIQFF